MATDHSQLKSYRSMLASLLSAEFFAHGRRSEKLKSIINDIDDETATKIYTMIVVDGVSTLATIQGLSDDILEQIEGGLLQVHLTKVSDSKEGAL